jgi:hypothetical protein
MFSNEYNFKVAIKFIKKSDAEIISDENGTWFLSEAIQQLHLKDVKGVAKYLDYYAPNLDEPYFILITEFIAWGTPHKRTCDLAEYLEACRMYTKIICFYYKLIYFL